MSRRQHSHQVTVRQGTSEKYWYTMAAYTAAFILFLAYFVYLVVTTTGSQSPEAYLTGGIMLALGILGLGVLGLGVYPALFKDSAYVRGSGYRWQPKWWYHVAVGLGLPVLAAMIAGALNVQSPGVTGVMVFPVSTAAVSVHYLYNRHKYLGVP